MLAAANPFEGWFAQAQERYSQKWSSYLEVYERYLAPWRNRTVHLLELGVQSGGSQLMWRKALGRGARVYGVDVEPEVTRWATRGITNFIGDVGDVGFLQSVCRQIPRLDVVVDDASHLNWHQRLAFEALYPCLNPEGGVYIVEDISTSYKPSYGGGYRAEGSFLEFAKAKIDELQAFWSCSVSTVSDRWGRCSRGRLQVPISAFTRSTHAIHVHDGLIVFEKRLREVAKSLETGSQRLPKRFIGHSGFRPHFTGEQRPLCGFPWDVQVHEASFQSLANATIQAARLAAHSESEAPCTEAAALLQDGLHWSGFGMDFTLVQLNRAGLAVEWNASARTPLWRYLRSMDRDVKTLLERYFPERGSGPLVVMDLLYRSRLRDVAALRFSNAKLALQMQQDGFLRIPDFGLDLDQLQKEVGDFAGTRRVLAKATRLEALEPLLKNQGLLELASFYLGAEVEVTGYKLLRLKPGLTAQDYISGFWHHDNCGTRLKLFIFLQEVGEDGFPTEIARGSQSLAYYWYGPAHMSRFSPQAVASAFSVERLLSFRGGGFLFDTNAIHRAKLDGPAPPQPRDAVVLEIANRHKLQEKIPSQGPCPEPKTYRLQDVTFPFPHRRFRQRRPGL
ncbi:unnamed protein product [Effrenium voratum]|uniref:Uncharacterized protein n=1 Tax=Effrenium voratum TaxID=2562239 RepID=A0AA36NC13_9DINO|nr:unnamed protein product [Effrenium voratum]